MCRLFFNVQVICIGALSFQKQYYQVESENPNYGISLNSDGSGSPIRNGRSALSSIHVLRTCTENSPVFVDLRKVFVFPGQAEVLGGLAGPHAVAVDGHVMAEHVKHVLLVRLR